MEKHKYDHSDDIQQRVVELISMQLKISPDRVRDMLKVTNSDLNKLVEHVQKRIKGEDSTFRPD